MWKFFIRKNLLEPLVRRAGTMLAAFLVAKGIDAPTIDLIVNGVAAAAAVSFDLGLSYLDRKKANQ